MGWQQGRAVLDGMMARGELERVPASRDHADVLLDQARQHLDSARAIAGGCGRSTVCAGGVTRPSTRPLSTPAWRQRT
jgi:hypothetical protein